MTTLFPTNKSGTVTASLGNVSLSQGLDTITFSLTGAIDGASTNLDFSGFRLDYTGITAVPEPANYALSGFGLIFVGAGAVKLYRRRSQTSA